MKSCFHYLRAIRVHQWIKNVLVFVPVLTAHQLNQPMVVERTLLAAIAFCFISSAVYIWNDLSDIEADRKHSTKRNRPFAAGHLTPRTGLLLATGCAVMALGAGIGCGLKFMEILAGYVLLNFLYSAFLKKEPVLDVVILSGFYTLRLFAGGVASGITLSAWLLIFSVFFFFGLALVKRYAELLEIVQSLEKSAAGRGYLALDLTKIGALGVSSGMISVLVLALYVQSPDVLLLYHHPKYLLLLCPLLIYWIGRIWTLANRGAITGDPIVFTLKDGRSYIIGVAALAIIYSAT
jgi:4-hydroxybenzoate polyprenyltransferase